MEKRRFVFTAPRLRAIEPPKTGRLFYHDLAVRGLALQVTCSGSATFYVYRKFRSRPVKILLGRFDPALPEGRELPEGSVPLDLIGNRPGLNPKMARQMAVAVMGQLDSGIHPNQDQTRRGIPLGEVFSRYIAVLRAEGKRGVSGRIWLWERFLGSLADTPPKKHGKKRTKPAGAVDWSKRGIGEVTHADVGRLRLDIGQQCGHTTSNRVIELLSCVYRFARRQRLYSGENPVQGSGKFKTQSRDRFLQPDEVQRFFEALDAEADDDFQDYIKLSLCTGARRANVLRARWEDIDLQGARWKIPGEYMKAGQELSVPLVEDAIELLRRRQRQAEGPFVFPGRSAAGCAGPFRRGWDRLLTRAGIRQFTVHDMRRTVGAWMAATGSSTVTTMAALGHRSVAAALVYQRLSESPVREAMQKAADAMKSAAIPPAPAPRPRLSVRQVKRRGRR